jgi:hypothetical protein
MAQDGSAFFLNAFGNNNRYTILRFDGDRSPSPVRSIIGPNNDGGAGAVAWPSGFKVNGKERVYASRRFNGKWTDVGIWESSDGQNFAFVGPALAASSDEPGGIGPAQIYYAEGEPRPFKMVYLVRGEPVGTSVALATSEDGLSWQRAGIVYRATQPWEATGIAPSFVARANDGTWVLTLNAYETIDKAHAAIATSSSPNGPFTNPLRIMEPVPSRATVTGARRMVAYAQISGPVRLGEPHILRSSNPVAMEAVTPTKIVGSTVYFDRPLSSDFGSVADLVHTGFSKVDPSYIWQMADGSWRGYWTGYGAIQNVVSEYTFEVTAPSLEGPWSIVPSGFPFKPWMAEGLSSTENPTPLIEVPPLD